jgi:hypothetical protein
MNSAPKKVRICPEAVDAAIWAEACARMAGNALRPVPSAQHGTSLPNSSHASSPGNAAKSHGLPASQVPPPLTRARPLQLPEVCLDRPALQPDASNVDVD